jgi:membrane-associated protease RseP (regulator of RpoE activity)
MITLLILLAAVAILVWGFYRAKPYGKLGIFAWLQSIVLMAPWLLFFGLFSAGIYLNLAGVLLLVLVSAGIYIYLGRQLRAMGSDQLIAQRLAKLAADGAATDGAAANGESPQSSTTTSNETTDQEAPPVLGIPSEDLVALEGIFGVDTFFRTETVPYQQGAIFKGNLRGQPEPALERLTEAMVNKVGDRYRLFLIQDAADKPVVVVLPTEDAEPRQSSSRQKVLAVFLAIATGFTCLETGGILMGVDLATTPAQWSVAVPVAAGLIAILATHEAGHWIMARRLNIKISWPFFLPAWEIGSFGALIRFESLLPNRTALFDVAFAGPAAGGLFSLILLFLGLTLSHPGSQFQVPAEFFQGSVLVGALAKGVLGSALAEPLVDVHPLTLIGWLGLVITALNLMPAGQLDGGRIVQAIYGRKTAGRATVVTLIILAIASLANPLALYWAALILFLQRPLERPATNELIEPDDARAALGLLALFLMLATLVPLTPSLAGRLGIGG